MEWMILARMIKTRLLRRIGGNTPPILLAMTSANPTLPVRRYVNHSELEE
jgi:hypothetical protein